jgi:hypothetical protein
MSNVRPQILRVALWAVLLIGLPLTLAVLMLGIWNWDLTIPLIYTNGDDIWQLTLTKVLHDTGWILTNPYLGAPDVASWHHNAAAQTSALHSVLMLALSPFIHDAVQLQYIYYLLNFPLIVLTSFIACRLLGVSQLLAFCVGLLFAFTSFRIDNMFYSFISNYFMVPLALVVVVWVLTGKFAAMIELQDRSFGKWQIAARLIRTKDFILGLLFVALTAVSDGYYAFFTLLLLGFATFVRLLLGDWRHPLKLLPAGIYILALLAISTSLSLPLHNYKKSHWNEFYPNGIEDSSLTKYSFEAEVYSSSLKDMIAPIPQHRIAPLNRLGKWMIETSDAARTHKKHRAMVSLGMLGSLLFGVALVLLAIPSLRRSVVGPKNLGSDADQAPLALWDALLSLMLFIFLCSIVGGVGTLVALVFPTIRAYDRFPIFLLFVLYLGAACFVTMRMQHSKLLGGRISWGGVLLIVTAAALYEQTPSNVFKGDESSKSKFLAERSFVQKVEAALPQDAMVYQYPYSQYLRESKYYGWGSFSHIRLYLHSRQLRWSNGGAKNSPADDWNFRISQLPLDDLITELEAVGFSGFVIDGTVIKSGEYEGMRQAFASRGYEILEDINSNFTFVPLKDPGFRLVYDTTYREAEQIVITDPLRLASSELPQLIKREALQSFMAKQFENNNSVIRKSDHPEIFADGAALARGRGQTPITPIADMRGKMSCKVEESTNTLLLTLENQTNFDWKMAEGPLPLRIGVHFYDSNGKLLQFDNGFRVPTDAYIRHGKSSTIRLPLSTIPLSAEVKRSGPLIAEFAMVQDGNAWFGNVNCSVPLR